MRLFAVIGGEDPQEVIPLVETQLAVAERELREFPLRAQEKGADFVQAAAPSMQTLLDQFNHYQSWLSKLKQALEEQNHQGYVDAYEEAQALIPALFAALESYSKFFAAVRSFCLPLGQHIGPHRPGHWGRPGTRRQLGRISGRFPKRIHPETQGGQRRRYPR